MNVRYTVELTDEEREKLRQLLVGGEERARKIKRAQILLAAEQRVPDETIARTLGCGTSTIYGIKRRLVEEGLEAALVDRPRPGGERKLTGQEEALLVAVACSTPPTGRRRWTVKLKPWQKKMWSIPAVDAEFVERMEDVLELYAEPLDPARPVVSFDEKPYQLLAETRVPVRAQPGRVARIDYEHRRNGTVNIFAFIDAHRPWRHVKVTARRTNHDFAECMRDLVDIHYPHADRIRVVLDNLSTYRAKNLYDTFPAVEARRILRRLDFHYTPKHASWLNMVEIELSVLEEQCLARRIADRDMLAVQVEAWCEARNREGARIDWMFRLEDARRKMGHLYPAPFFDEALPLAA
ncbi:MAG: IS630 family transposase [Myxococcales bacterium]|nr:IS630 family transposase [Myxococcales bacterium]